jgi:CRISPR-associated endonuclease/helicase Cas3
MSNKLWAKLEKAEADHPARQWLSLVDHSADVAATFEAILRVPTVSRRLATLASISAFPSIWRPRLAAHVALHDFGKANRGFQARRDPKVPLARTAGHVVPGLALLYANSAPDLAESAMKVLPLNEMVRWGASEQGTETEMALRAVAAHHGRPISQNDIDNRERNRLPTLWGPDRDYDPIAALAPLGSAIRHDWFTDAFV